jgi:hypothetical protein
MTRLMPRDKSRTKHPSAKHITPEDVQVYIDSIGGIGPDGELLPEIREEFPRLFDKLGLKKPASWTNKD